MTSALRGRLLVSYDVRTSPAESRMR